MHFNETDGNSTKFNKCIPLVDDFNPHTIFISNNENFIGVIDHSKLLIYDTKSAKLVYNQTLPPNIDDIQKNSDYDEDEDEFTQGSPKSPRNKPNIKI
jgi:hypothetical protein